MWIGVIHSDPFLDHTLRILIQLNWVILAYNLNFREEVLMNHESSIGAFLLIALYFIYLVITLAYQLFLDLLSTNHKCTQPCYFPPATQTCCSEGEDRLEFFDEEFQAVCCPGCCSCGAMESSAILFHKRVTLVYKDIIYVINILYS
jgi:hypothetical protein